MTLAALRIPGAQSLPSYAKAEKAVAETIILEPNTPERWKKPPFQRPVQSTSDRVKEIAIAMQKEAAEDPDEAWCHITGTIQLGKFGRDEYLVDGQHRIAAFRLACGPALAHECVSTKQAIAEVSIKNYDSMGDMARAFQLMNTAINPIKPDDIMRAIAVDNPFVKDIQDSFPMIGYDRTGKEAKEKTLLSMSTAIRTWFGSGGLIPSQGPPVREAVKFLNEENTGFLKDFFFATMEAGWVSPVFQPLWSSLNLGINMWLWRKTVLGLRLSISGAPPGMVVTRDQYIKCMRTLSSNPMYLGYLRGRSLRIQDRRPTYDRMKEIYTPILVETGIDKPRFPMATDWGATSA